MGGLSDERAARMRLSQLAEPGDERLGRALEASSASSILARIEGGDRTLPGVEHYRSRLGVPRWPCSTRGLSEGAAT